jgi:hypothetical protein
VGGTGALGITGTSGAEVEMVGIGGTCIANIVLVATVGAFKFDGNGTEVLVVSC